MKSVNLIGLLAHPLTPSSKSSKLFLFLSLPLRRRSRLPTVDGAVGEGAGEEPNHATARKPDPLQIIHYPLGQG